ncbi:hypothetical protein EZV61_14425 [Corallincola luteus]|uniref:Type 4 fimbrial biogenesis protein PilX N-terminal domain-containing protein n=1 Tax=Corallincola luteus TaxID=1775177 RepID=A0ABY2AI60_9GAMM|nr:hypothetical protein [Corallincola luteus]TCI02134.1 hypothetical protein EZV61_14425 [Corallincola luteus]
MRYPFYRYQQGAALIAGMLFMGILTAVGVAVLTSSSFGLKLSGAAAMKVESTQATFGGVDEVVDQGTRGALACAGTCNNLVNLSDTFDEVIAVDTPGTTANVKVLNDAATGQPIASCPRDRQAWESQDIKCKSARVTSDHKFSEQAEQPRSGAEALVFQRYYTQG